MPYSTKLFLLFFTFSSVVSSAQSLAGLWIIDRVEVEGEIMTPEARWTKFDGSGHFTGGNGGYQHSQGNYTLDTLNSWLKLEEPLGIIDPFGPFSYQLMGDSMRWERMEEGQLVRVYLSRANELPQANADKIIGLWSVLEMTKEGKPLGPEYASFYDQTYFFRWDRVFVQFRKEAGPRRGMYRVNAHRPELTIFYQEKELMVLQQWDFSFEENQTLVLKGKSAENQGIEIVLERRHDFPGE
ncbi:MAG: hypothetical protein LPK45_07875 [Bacteroidota bacterium]|nr:hypothetical protein [Bacteroidota bacterium]MDX5430988.1 hypothetical protein [Bacteroidota bacterium]MDX5469739.1 hypothetical protein [Bacteroidota bacterium]